MRINLVKVKYGGSYTYKYKPFDYCCEKIKENRNIIFTDEDVLDFFEDYVDEHYEQIPQFCATSTEHCTSYEDEWEETSNYPIQYCPHCGEKIEISIVGEVDKSEEYKNLRKEREKAWDDSRITDSKKEEEQFKSKAQALDKKLNWYYHLNEYKEEER